MNSSTDLKQRVTNMKDPPFMSTAEIHEAPKITERPSPYIPTPLESLILSIYPITLIVGSLFSLLDPAARNSPYNPNTQSHFQSSAPSYFAKKNNIFNLYFVKRGWAWITLSYVFFLFSHPSTGATGSLSITRKRLQGLIRYGIVTIWWIFVTQWFFGPPLIDRGFTLTGGQCVPSESRKSPFEDQTVQLTALACKAVGGNWRGGHDVSGHVFLLVLGSMFIFEEVLHVALPKHHEERTVTMIDGALKSANIDLEDDSFSELLGVWTLGSKIAIAVASMSLYMLLMTAAYFHTWVEKLTGLAIALAGIFVVYFLPRKIPKLRSVISMPGI